MRSFLIILFLAVGASANAQLTINSYADKNVLGDSETVAYTLEISGDLSDLGRIQPPDATGLTLTSGTPVLRSQMRTNTGADQLTLRWLYRPQRTGQAQILSARIPVGNQVLTTDPIDVEIVPQSQRGAARQSRIPQGVDPSTADIIADGDLFIRGIPSTRTAVVGEQILVDYVLYYKAGFRPRDSEINGALNAEGFWRETLEIPQQERIPRRVTIGEDEYFAGTLLRIALFPTRAGELEVSEMQIRTQLVRSGRPSSPFDSFFSPFSNRIVTEELTADAVGISVSELPANAPESYFGSVGRFGMAAFTSQDRVEAGDPVELTVEIQGEGNIATLSPPELDLPETFEVVGPGEDRNIDLNGGPISGAKTFTYTLIPQSGGDFVIPPVEWTYFDPSRGAFETLRSSSFDLEVSGSVVASATVSEGNPSDPSLPIGMFESASWSPDRASGSIPTGLLFGGFGLPLLALLGLVGIHRFRNREPDTSPEALALRAHPEAKKRLKEAKKAVGREDFYSIVERSVRSFLSERLAIPTVGSTKATLIDTLSDRGVQAQTCEGVTQLLAECERAQFAPTSHDDDNSQSALIESAAMLFAKVNAEAQEVEA